MRAWMMMAGICLAICATDLAAQPHQEFSKGLSHQVLFDASIREGVACYRIPALVTAPNGDLIAAVDERVSSCADLRDNRDINIVIRRSIDGGATWSAIETVADFPDGRSASDPSMIVNEVTGTIFLFYNYMDLDAAPGRYRMHVLSSTDNGRTWIGPTDISHQILRPEWRDDFVFITSGRGTQTRSGALLHTLVHLEEGVFVFSSEEHGASWFRLDVPVRPADESKIVELSDGRWMINSRVNGAGVRYVRISSDRGRTWESQPDSVLIDPAANAGLLAFRMRDAADDVGRPRTETSDRLQMEDGSAKDGHVLLFSNPASSTRRENLTVRASFDDGATWSADRVIYPGPSAYSTLTELDDGTIGLLFEKDEYAKVAFVKFSLDWLMEDVPNGSSD